MPFERFTFVRALRFLFALGCASPAFAHSGHLHFGSPPPTQDVAPETAPQISAFTISRTLEGFLLELATQNFTFVPLDAPEAGSGQGHAHLFINGTFLAEMPSASLVLPELPFGPHEFRVVLTSVYHIDYALKGRVTDARLSFTVE